MRTTLQGEIRVGKSEYEEFLEVVSGPLGDNIRTDYVLQAVSGGAFICMSTISGYYSFKEIMPIATNTVAEMKPIVADYFSNTKINFAIGCEVGYLSKKLDLSPDITFPNPAMDFGNQLMQFGVFIKEDLDKNGYFNSFFKDHKNDTTKERQNK